MLQSKTVLFLVLVTFGAFAQPEDSLKYTKPNVKKLRIMAAGAAITYTAAMVGLNQIWYKDNQRKSFYFFNDNAEWKQMDKIGHFYSAFYLSYGTAHILRSQHVRPSKADLIAALTGFGMMLPIEIMDGFSKDYGASVGDLIANGAGSAFYLLQRYQWNEVRIYPKFSFHRTSYPPLRPNILGNGLTEEIIKDYNGQTYWLSFDMDRFIAFPKWLNVAVGYGAEGMIYARDAQHPTEGFALPYRQYYLSLDFDLSGIRTRSKAIKTLLFVANMIKIPAPTLGMSKNGLRFYPLYF